MSFGFEVISFPKIRLEIVVLDLSFLNDVEHENDQNDAVHKNVIML